MMSQIGLAFVLISLGTLAEAIETGRFEELSPDEEQRLELTFNGQINSPIKLGRFVLGGWPDGATYPAPEIEPGLTVLQGMRENREWANPFLLRLDPAEYRWISNLSAHAASRYNSIGSGRILVAFELPVCAIGLLYAQTGAHNEHHPDLRRRTSFSFFAEDGSLIDIIDQTPGRFTVQTAFSREVSEPAIWAMMIDSEVSVAVIELIGMECAFQLG